MSKKELHEVLAADTAYTERLLEIRDDPDLSREERRALLKQLDQERKDKSLRRRSLGWGRHK